MNVLFISIDSLRRDFLGAYRERPWVLDYAVETDNLDRFAQRAAVFDSHWAGSLFCMPARREWYAGVQEFLWRNWGPIEPYDVTLPLKAREAGAVTKLVTDHYHLFQHGSHGYFEDFNGFEFVRGHECDAWKTVPREPDEAFRRRVNAEDPTSTRFMQRAQYARNVDDFEDESDFFAPQVFDNVADWLDANQDWEQWFCFVDSFDVHEPIHCPEPYASMYTDEDPQDPSMPLWPYWGQVDRGQSELTERELAFVRAQFAGKVTMVDRWFGRVLDVLDERNLWDDTMVIVTADHGFSLGDHGWIGKVGSPLYGHLANTPLLVWHPDTERTGERISELTSAVDLHATAAEALGADTESPHSRSLLSLLRGETDNHRDWALFGNWGAEANVTDGRYVYYHPCDPDVPAENYATTMMSPRGPFKPDEPDPDADAGQFLPYTDSPVWRRTAPSRTRHDDPLLFDLASDPRQKENLAGRGHEAEPRLRGLLVRALDELDAPTGQYDRLALD